MKARMAGISCAATFLAFFAAGTAFAKVVTDAGIEAVESGLRPAVAVDGAAEVRWSIRERMEHYRVPGVSVAVIRNGKIAWAKGYGLRQADGEAQIDSETVFSVGSLSKVGAAAVALRMVEAGELGLDQDVRAYLDRWRLPEDEYTAIRPVTLRGILSHSAGLTVNGFPDFEPGEALPTIVDVLEGRPPAKTDPVVVDYVPGSRSRYSGGGTTVAQLVVEDVTGASFAETARRSIFEPLDMARSTYENPLPASFGNIARAHGPDGEPRALPRGWESMPENAASGLWTTPSDYARLVVALIESYRGQPEALLSQSIAREMMTEVGASRFGLGPEMAGRGMTRSFSHSGANNSYKAWMEGHLATGNGVVVFTNGTGGSALRGEIRRAVAHAEGWQIGRSVLVPDYDPTEAELNALAGLYAVNPARTLAALRMREDAAAYRVSVADGSLYIQRTGVGKPVRLIPADTVTFVEAESGERFIEFTRDYSGSISGLRVHAGGNMVEARRVPGAGGSIF